MGAEEVGCLLAAALAPIRMVALAGLAAVEKETVFMQVLAALEIHQPLRQMVVTAHPLIRSKEEMAVQVQQAGLNMPVVVVAVQTLQMEALRTLMGRVLLVALEG